MVYRMGRPGDKRTGLVNRGCRFESRTITAATKLPMNGQKYWFIVVGDAMITMTFLTIFFNTAIDIDTLKNINNYSDL